MRAATSVRNGSSSASLRLKRLSRLGLGDDIATSLTRTFGLSRDSHAAGLVLRVARPDELNTLAHRLGSHVHRGLHHGTLTSDTRCTATESNFRKQSTEPTQLRDI